jgi:hypothetical protein
MLYLKDNLRHFREVLQKIQQLTVVYKEMVNFDLLVKTASRVLQALYTRLTEAYNISRSLSNRTESRITLQPWISGERFNSCASLGAQSKIFNELQVDSLGVIQQRVHILETGLDQGIKRQPFETDFEGMDPLFPIYNLLTYSNVPNFLDIQLFPAYSSQLDLQSQVDFENNIFWNVMNQM